MQNGRRGGDSLAGIRDRKGREKLVNEMLEIFYRDPPWDL